MKVIHVVHGKANPSGHNGISRVVYYLNKHEKLAGCDSQIWAIVDDIPDYFSHRRDEFVTVECFPRVHLPWGKHQIVERLLASKADLVHFHLIWFFDKNIIANALKKAGMPFIVTTHGTYSKPHAYTGKRRIARWLYELRYLNKAAEIHVLTHEEGIALSTYGYRGKTFVAYNGVELSEIPQQRSNAAYRGKPYGDKIKLVWVGVPREDKNLRALVRAMTLLPQALRDQLVCVLVGPAYKENPAAVLRLAKKLGCADCFDYIGPLYGQAKYDAIESADAYVLPSVSEGFSLAMLDALACGKPALATTGCGYATFNDDFLVSCEPYPEDIARGIESLVARRSDWPSMGANARRLVERDLNWDAISKVMLTNYLRIVSKTHVD